MLLALFGNPIKHSRSPSLHAHFAEKIGVSIDYQLIEVDDAEQFEVCLSNFQNQGALGCNVTAPLKEAAYGVVDELSDNAKMASAVNTILFKSNGTRFGDNTDGIGLIRDLIENHHVSIKNKTMLIMGAGGAVKGVLKSLRNQNPKKIVIVNRSKEKAIDLAEQYNLDGCGYNDLGDQIFDIIINGTSASLFGEMPPLPETIMDQKTFCYDLAYSDNLTPFLQWSERQGAEHFTDGKGMLDAAALASFQLWFGDKFDGINNVSGHENY